ncbi:MAG: hypothetical protein QOH55_2180 [Microbacteriaceae bacterium]|jgi:DNA-binding GntR family transcriptional regulator|nr:hypothetical protein [Microbacteriaceae bacterium]
MSGLGRLPGLATTRSTGRLAGSLHEVVKERLISGEFPAGSRLSIDAFKSEFGVSKQPIMEALRLLSADGLVEIVPQVGSTVMTYSLQDVADFYEMFAGFEGAVAAAAAERRSPEQLRYLQEVHESIGRLRDEPDPAVRATSYRLLNRAFHAAIHDMSRSRIMSDTSSRMWDLSDFLINTTGAHRPLSSATSARHADHDAIRMAIEAGDAVLARREMENHILGTVDIIRDKTLIAAMTPAVGLLTGAAARHAE